jgi:putative FmdB family regulatory protein
VPTYEYRATDPEHGCECCRVGLEVLQGMAEPRLEHCPHCQGRIERVITAARINTQPSARSLLSDDNLRKHGFKKLVKEDGGYRQTV